MAMMAVLGELNDGAEIKDFKLLEVCFAALVTSDLLRATILSH
jgi:hypothetical protein